MSKKGINPDPNGKGENWPQFLKDINDPQIMGILNDDPAMRLNRKSRRIIGKTKDELQEEAIQRASNELDNREKIKQFRAFKVGEWWRDTFEKLIPKWAFNRVLNGKRGILLTLGYQYGSEDGNDLVDDKTAPLGHRLQPYTRAWITRKRFILFGVPVLCKVKVPHKIKKVINGEEQVFEEMIEVETWFKFIWEA